MRALPLKRIGRNTCLTPQYRLSSGLPSFVLNFEKDISFVNNKSKKAQNILTTVRNTAATYTDANGVIQTAAINEMRSADYSTGRCGLLIEPLSTNYYNNSVMSGAVIGSPGTLPSNTAVEYARGLSTYVVGKGTEDGLSYVDLRIFGTTDSSSAYQMRTGSTNIGGYVGQYATVSSYVRRIGGSTSNITNMYIQVLEAGGAYPGTMKSIISNVENSRLSLCRVSSSRLTTTTTYIQWRLGISPSALGVAIDITLRISGIQIEAMPYATSYIPTTGASASRAADVISMTGTNFSDWYNQKEGTFVIDVYNIESGGITTYPYVLDTTDGTTGNRISFLIDRTSTPHMSLQIYNSGSYQGMSTTSFNPTAVRSIMAGSYATNDMVFVADGGTLYTDTSCIIPSALTSLRIGSSLSSTTASTVFHKILYYPKRISNAELQKITSVLPVNTVLPQISGDIISGETLTVNTGTWTGLPAPTYTYKWYKNNTIISGEVSNTYTLTDSDIGYNIKAEVIATNYAGSVSAFTAKTDYIGVTFVSSLETRLERLYTLEGIETAKTEVEADSYLTYLQEVDAPAYFKQKVLSELNKIIERLSA